MKALQQALALPLACSPLAFGAQRGTADEAVALVQKALALLVNYPPKVSVSNLVNRLKGGASRMIRKRNDPRIRQN